jgi:LmbE family N-acetylglucosaminyl deacetylase
LRVFRISDDAPRWPELDALSDEIRALLEAFPAAQLLAPLAVGNHVDHVALFAASVRALLGKGAADRFRFYEDVYAMGTLARRRHFVTRTRSWHYRDAPELTSLAAAVTLSTIALVNRGAGLESCLPPAARRLSWRCETIPLGEHEGRKMEAVLDYRSQIKAMGGPSDASLPPLLGWRRTAVESLAEPLARR